MDFAVWLAGAGRQSCRDCRDAYERASRPSRWDRMPPARRDPPCTTCRPAIRDGAEIVALTLSRVQSQWILDGLGRPLALRYEAVAAAAAAAGMTGAAAMDIIDEVMRLGGVMASCHKERIEETRNAAVES